MSVYLRDIPLNAARDIFREKLQAAGLWKILESETIPVDQNAVGRTLSEPVWAELCSPHYHASAMDGYALRAEDTAGALPSSPRTFSLPAQARYVDTGDPLPEGANAVIPIENVEALDGAGRLQPGQRFPAAIRLRAAVTPWSHVRPVGEDIVASQLVLPSGHTLRPVDLGAAAACGKTTLVVSRKPRVAIIPTGTELAPLGLKVQAGEIIEYNSIVLAGQVDTWGGQGLRFPIVADNFEDIRARVIEAASTSDLVLLNAGSSAGSEDFSARVIESLGEVYVHGVAVRPGHPVILGMLIQGQKRTPVIGVPGYPVSAAMTGEIFVEPLIGVWLGKPAGEPLEIEAVLTRKITSPAGDDDYLRVAVGKVGDRVLAAPLNRGAGVITSLVQADGIVIIPGGSQGMEAGTRVRVRMYRSPREVERTIFAIGSHDMTLDLVAQRLTLLGRRLVSVNVGSQGGLAALRRGEAHLAGSHLLDPESGVTNIPYLKQYLIDIPVRLMRWVGRQQGLLVLPGNPKGISGLEDLRRSDIRVVNRQRGAGTRVLLDYHLSRLRIDPGSIQGYDMEEYTHLSVAAAVSSGRADTGLGIAAAAQALGLDFIPLFDEQYDLVIPLSSWENPLLQPLIELAGDPRFRRDVAAMPGYDVSEMGRIIGDF